jgi:hypothetical protein
LAAQRDIDPATLQAFLLWLLGLGLAILATVPWARPRRAGSAVVLATAAIWVAYGVGLAPTLDADSSSRELMQRVAQRIGPRAELGMVAWREQNMLQSDRPVTDFGFKRPWHAQWNDASPWLLARPRHRWLFVLNEAVSPCVDRSRSVPIGQSNRKSWVLVPASALAPGCTTPAWERPAAPD